jgi:hypothetical protein
MSEWANIIENYNLRVLARVVAVVNNVDVV